MFGLGFGEMLLILAVALVVIGPKKLPGLARTLGRGLAEVRRYTDDIQRTVQRELRAPLGDDTQGPRPDAPGQRSPGPPPDAGTLSVNEPEPRADEPSTASNTDPGA
ncbi:MAG: twin-arginine translocase subunit TatB [Deltaproteobacteria bacterium]|nr:twin-arginine translocase subunit TatB [Deltaproteobacteria bacterium]